MRRIGDCQHPRRIGWRSETSLAWTIVACRHHHHNPCSARRRHGLCIGRRPRAACIPTNRIVDDIDAVGHRRVDRRQQPTAQTISLLLASFVADQIGVRCHTRECAHNCAGADAQTDLQGVARRRCGDMAAMPIDIQTVVRLGAAGATREITNADQFVVAG